MPTPMPSEATKSLTIKRPIAGSTFFAGDTHNITWSYTGAIGWVSLFLFQDDVYHSKVRRESAPYRPQLLST